MRTKGCLLLLLSVVTASKHFYPDLSIVKGTSLRLGLAGKRVFYCRIFEVFFYVHLTKLFYTEKIQFMSVIRKKKLKPWESGISWLSADAYWIFFFRTPSIYKMHWTVHLVCLCINHLISNTHFLTDETGIAVVVYYVRANDQERIYQVEEKDGKLLWCVNVPG